MLLGAASVALLVVAGMWWALGSFSFPCSTQESLLPDGTIETISECSAARSRYASDGLLGVLWLGLPALSAVIALALTPVPRIRAAARWVVGVAVLLLGLLSAFTPFLFLLLPAGILMVLSALLSDAPPAAQPEDSMPTAD